MLAFKHQDMVEFALENVSICIMPYKCSFAPFFSIFFIFRRVCNYFIFCCFFSMSRSTLFFVQHNKLVVNRHVIGSNVCTCCCKKLLPSLVCMSVRFIATTYVSAKLSNNTRNQTTGKKRNKTEMPLHELLLFVQKFKMKAA